MLCADRVVPNALESGFAVSQRESALPIQDVSIFYTATVLQTEIVFCEDQTIIEDHLVLIESDACSITVRPNVDS